MSDERELVVAKEPSGFWAIRENGRLAITSKSYNEIRKAINTYARAYEEHGVAHTISVRAEAAFNVAADYVINSALEGETNA